MLFAGGVVPVFRQGRLNVGLGLFCGVSGWVVACMILTNGLLGGCIVFCFLF